MEKFPSMAKINQAIAGPRRMGSENSVENRVKEIHKFIAFLEFKDPETVLETILNGKIDATFRVDEFMARA